MRVFWSVISIVLGRCIVKGQVKLATLRAKRFAYAGSVPIVIKELTGFVMDAADIFVIFIHVLKKKQPRKFYVKVRGVKGNKVREYSKHTCYIAAHHEGITAFANDGDN